MLRSKLLRAVTRRHNLVSVRHALALALLASIGGPAGCATAAVVGINGEADAGHADADVSTPAAFCKARAAAECSGAVVSSCKATSADACIAARVDACTKDLPQGTTFVAANAPACVAAIQAAYATATLHSSDLAAIDTACGPALFAGPKQARDACTVGSDGRSWDCDTSAGLTCIIPPSAPAGSTTGKCLAPHVMTAGQDCFSDEAAVCASGSYCDSIAKICKPAGIAGGSCQAGTNASCQSGNKCVGGGPFTPPTCKPMKAIGESCTAGSDCASGLCDKTSLSSTGNCVDPLSMTSIANSCNGFH